MFLVDFEFILNTISVRLENNINLTERALANDIYKIIQNL